MPKIDKQKLLESIQIDKLHPSDKELKIDLDNIEFRLDRPILIHKRIDNIHIHRDNKL